MDRTTRGARRRGPSGAALATALLAAVTTAGCGGSTPPDPTSPAAAVETAAGNAREITSLRYRVGATLPEWGRVTAEASMTTEPVAMSMRLSPLAQGRGAPLELRFVDDVMYVAGGALDPSVLGGRTWAAADPARWGGSTADNTSYGMLPRQIEASPLVQSTFLTGSEDVRRLGTETVEGTRTTHYRGTVTMAGLIAARDAAPTGAIGERRIDSLDAFVGLSLDGPLTMDLWTDADDRPRRFRLRGATRTTRGGTPDQPLELVPGDPLDLTITFLTLDHPTTIDPPPPQDTADIPAPTAGTPAARDRPSPAAHRR
ncbi:hypothetical protein [Streptomyces tagetis]|uniref:Lipoprotein n=1 Tax=Streptomyces tagetis TaxID=2820809 RepID=A0A940XF54_9ACTN|nr:hypothetical protein [Streptomyces sp. RG38]MBQ0829203.1 hypothetical protein [Streptomyces sp. RG38]